MKINDDNIISLIVAASAALLVVLAVGGLIVVSGRFAAGVASGGFIALANFFWLGSALKRTLQLPAANAARVAFIRYVGRLSATGFVLYLLVVVVGVDIAGLLLGLSVLVCSISGLAFYMLTFKGGS